MSWRRACWNEIPTAPVPATIGSPSSSASPSVGVLQARENPSERRLARAVVTGDDDTLTPLEIEIDTVRARRAHGVPLAYT